MQTFFSERPPYKGTGKGTGLSWGRLERQGELGNEGGWNGQAGASSKDEEVEGVRPTKESGNENGVVQATDNVEEETKGNRKLESSERFHLGKLEWDE